MIKILCTPWKLAGLLSGACGVGLVGAVLSHGALSLENRGVQQVTHTSSPWSHPGVNPLVPPHTSLLLGPQTPHSLGDWNRAMGGAVFLFPKLLPPPPCCRLPTRGRLCPLLLSTLGSAQAVQSGLLPASSSVWGCWHSWAHRPAHPTSALSLRPLPLCADVSVSSEDTGLRFGAVLLQCELILT